MSRKNIFAALFAVCLLTSSIVYLSDMEFASPRLAVTRLWNLTDRGRDVYFKLFGSANNTGQTTAGEEDLGEKVETSTFVNTTPAGFLTHPQHDPAEKRPFLKSISKNSSRSMITQANNNSSTPLTPEVLPNTTSMTFNTSLVGCKESPYVECFPPNLKPVKGKIFKISFLRRPSFFPSTSLSVTNCKINQCVTDDKVTNETDVVIVYGVGLKDNFPVPRRWPHQLYAIQVWESPVHTHADFLTNGNSPWNQRINIIMSYRLDGDGVFPYGRLVFKPTPLGQRPNYYQIAQNKTRTAVWIVSHCKTHARREEYVKQMQKYIDVDIFGNCGTPCPTKNTTCNNWATTYKFYLAFENSLCTDYVTEKFFKLFEPNVFVIPVVRGGADYDKHFPNFTYINSAHFKTPKDLALHLKHLAADLDTYSKYLEYKDLYHKPPYENIYCKMCEYVHTHKLPQTSQFYHLTSWLGGEHCHHPTDV